MLQELSLQKCPALKQLPESGQCAITLTYTLVVYTLVYVMHIVLYLSTNLTNTYSYIVAEITSLKQLDLRPLKKPVCKITPGKCSMHIYNTIYN